MDARGRLVAVEGGSGAGKTTLVRTASRTLDWDPLAEAFDRLDPAPSLDFASPTELLRIEATLLAEEARRYRWARRRVASGRTVLADTGFLGPVSYTAGLIALGRVPAAIGRSVRESARSAIDRGSLGIPDLTVYLKTTAVERSRRAAADRVHHPSSLGPRHEAVSRVEARCFEGPLPATLPDRFRTLRAGSEARTLVPRLGALVDRADPSPASRKEALVALALLAAPAETPRRGAAGTNR